MKAGGTPCGGPIAIVHRTVLVPSPHTRRHRMWRSLRQIGLGSCIVPFSTELLLAPFSCCLSFFFRTYARTTVASPRKPPLPRALLLSGSHLNMSLDNLCLRRKWSVCELCIATDTRYIPRSWGLEWSLTLPRLYYRVGQMTTDNPALDRHLNNTVGCVFVGILLELM